jgi:hypothetical protein
LAFVFDLAVVFAAIVLVPLVRCDFIVVIVTRDFLNADESAPAARSALNLPSGASQIE